MRILEKRIRELLDAYVDDVKARAPIKSEAVERAFRRVERHKLVEHFFDYREEREGFEKVSVDPARPSTDALRTIYSDSPLMTRLSGGLPSSSTSQPALVAQMLELLELTPGQRGLEIGAGTGYNAALMQEMVGETGHVTTIDIQEDVVAQTRRLLRAAGYDRIEVIARDGVLGCPENAPYDRIIATVGCPDISPSWTDQLSEGGFMLIPLQHGPEGFDPLARIWKDSEHVLGRFVGSSGFMSIQGELASEQKLSFADQKQARTGVSLAELPLPVSVGIWSDLDRPERMERQFALGLFLAIADERGSWSGVVEKARGACLFARGKADKVEVYGDVSLYDEFVQLCQRWERLGSPAMEKWALEFFATNSDNQPPEGENAWVIPREFTIEVARLRKANDDSSC